MSNPALRNNFYGQSASLIAGQDNVGGLARTSDPAQHTSAFAITRHPDAIVVFDLIGMVTSLVAKTPYFQTRLSNISPGTHYMLVLLQLGYNAQQMDYLNTHGDYIGTGHFCGSRMLQQGGANGGVMMLYAPLPELPSASNAEAIAAPQPGKQAYINPTTFLAPEPTPPVVESFSNNEVYNPTFMQSMSQDQHTTQAPPQHLQFQAISNPSPAPALATTPQPLPPRVSTAPETNVQAEPIATERPAITGNLALDAQALIDAAVKAALAEQAQNYQSANKAPEASTQRAIVSEAPIAEKPEPLVEVLEVYQTEVVPTPTSYSQASITPEVATQEVPMRSFTESPIGHNTGHKFALAEDMPNSFVVHPTGPQAKGQFVWQHRNNDLHIIAYGICLPSQPNDDITEPLNLLQNALHNVVVQLGNAEADDIMIGVNDAYQNKLNTANEATRKAYVEVSVCILNSKQKVVDLAGAPYGSFFLRNNNVSGIHNGRIAALASQMTVNKQDLRCARFRTEELTAVYLFGIGSIVQGNDITKASKTHNQVTQMLESVMKMGYAEQYEAMKNHLGMLVGPSGVLPILIGLKPV